MRISVVADVHGNTEALARVAEKAERLVVLGDLLDYVDYHDPRRGIVAEVFGADAVARFTVMRSKGAFAELRRYNAQLWSSLADPVGVLSGLVQARYRAVVDGIPADSLVILGNVDVAAEWERVARGRLPVVDGTVVDVDGVRLAFVGGGVRRSLVTGAGSVGTAASVGSDPARRGGPATPWQPFIRDHDEYVATVAALGEADVLCSHIPPGVPLMRYDTVPGRVEMFGPGLADYIRLHRPALSLSGHVHQPLAFRRRLGWTECVNVGHFQRRESAFTIDTERLRGAVGRTEAPSAPAAVPAGR